MSGGADVKSDMSDALDAKDREIAKLRSELLAAEPVKLLVALVGEVDFVISGGDNPPDRCQECGLAGIGMLRDARKGAVDYLRRIGRLP